MTPEDQEQPEQQEQQEPETLRKNGSHPFEDESRYSRHLQPPMVEPYQKTFMEGEKNFSNIVNHLLKKPLSVIHTINEKGGVSYLPILIMTIVSLALFGFIIGSFNGVGAQMWAAPVKIIFGVLFSSIICLSGVQWVSNTWLISFLFIKRS